MAEILTKELVTHAINFLRPSIREILENMDCIWGPTWVEIVFSGPRGLFVQSSAGFKTEWNPAWGEQRDFSAVAEGKHNLSQRERMSGSAMVQHEPWRLQRGDWLYSGSAYREGGLVCGVSGAKGEVDEMIANLVLETVIGLCILRRRELHDNGVKQIC